MTNLLALLRGIQARNRFQNEHWVGDNSWQKDIELKPWIPGPQPIDEPSYEAIMLSLDRHLEDQDFHIHQRPLHAASLLAKAYGTTERMQMIPAPRMEDHPK